MYSHWASVISLKIGPANDSIWPTAESMAFSPSTAHLENASVNEDDASINSRAAFCTNSVDSTARDNLNMPLVWKGVDRRETRDENKNDGVVQKAKEALLKAEEEMKVARIREANARHCLEHMQAPLFKEGFKTFAKTSEALARKTAVLWEGVHNAVEAMPSLDGEGVDVPATRDILKSAVGQVPEVSKKCTQRLPGVFLYKKAEKKLGRGRDKKRFFQIEPAEDGGTGAVLAYYRDVENGRAVELKGSIALDHDTSITVKKSEICIKTDVHKRTWTLTVRT